MISVYLLMTHPFLHITKFKKTGINLITDLNIINKLFAVNNFQIYIFLNSCIYTLHILVYEKNKRRVFIIAINNPI